MNGRQLADAARQQRPGLKVLFITGYAESAAVGNGLDGTGHAGHDQALSDGCARGQGARHDQQLTGLKAGATAPTRGQELDTRLKNFPP